MICIYVITNIINDKQYVGQAVVKDKRWRDHRIMLKAGKHRNRHLQASYNKYGKDAFVYTVLEIVSDVSLFGGKRGLLDGWTCRNHVDCYDHNAGQRAYAP